MVDRLADLLQGDGPEGAGQKGSPAKEAVALAKAGEELKHPKLSEAILAAAEKAPKKRDAVTDFDFDGFQNDDASVVDDASTYEDGFSSDATVPLDYDEAEDEDTDDAATVPRVAAEAPWMEPSPRRVHAAAAVPTLPLSGARGPEALSQPVVPLLRLPAGDGKQGGDHVVLNLSIPQEPKASSLPERSPTVRRPPTSRSADAVVMPAPCAGLAGTDMFACDLTDVVAAASSLPQIWADAMVNNAGNWLFGSRPVK
jgi:hypothetical protein